MITQFIRPLKQYRSIILLAFALFFFACYGLLEESAYRAAWINAITILFVLMLFLSISYDGKQFSTFGKAMTCLAFGVVWLDNIFPADAKFYTQLEDIALWFLIGGFICSNIQTLIGKDWVGTEHLSASFALYLLIGTWWGFLYQFIWTIDSFAFSGDPLAKYTLGDFFQYSLSTITTISTSTINAHSPLVRCLSTIEAVCGQFYFAILIGGLVGTHISRRIK